MLVNFGHKVDLVGVNVRQMFACGEAEPHRGAEPRRQKAQPSNHTFVSAFLSAHTFIIFTSMSLPHPRLLSFPSHLVLTALTYKICGVVIPLDEIGQAHHGC